MEELEKSWKSPQTSPSAWNLGAVFPLFLQEKGPGWDLGSLPNPGFFLVIIPLPKEKFPLFLLFSPFFQLFSSSCSLGNVQPSVRVPFPGTSGIPGLWNRLLPNKKHRERSQMGKKTSRENKQTPKITKKGRFHWKSFPRPIQIREFLGKARRGPRNPKSPQNPTSQGIPGGIWDHPSPNPIPTFPSDTGKDSGGFMYTAPIPGLGANPGILGIPRFLGTLSCPQG